MACDVVEFGQPWPKIHGVTRFNTKPRIRKVGFGWECSNLGYVGAGHSPQAAYSVWQYVYTCKAMGTPPLHLRLLASEDRT